MTVTAPVGTQEHTVKQVILTLKDESFLTYLQISLA